jgi:hypothetical protein
MTIKLETSRRSSGDVCLKAQANQHIKVLTATKLFSGDHSKKLKFPPLPFFEPN